MSTYQPYDCNFRLLTTPVGARNDKSKIKEKNDLVTDYEWKMHKLQVAARKPKPSDLAVDNKYHPDWYTNKTNMVNRLQGHVEYLKDA